MNNSGATGVENFV